MALTEQDFYDVIGDYSDAHECLKIHITECERIAEDFSEWIAENYYQWYNPHEWMSRLTGDKKSTKELYQDFKNSQNK